MKLTSNTLKSIYMMLRVLKPFNGWSMPVVEDVKFVVSSDTDCLGTYVFDDELEKHIITISKEKNGHAGGLPVLFFPICLEGAP